MATDWIQLLPEGVSRPIVINLRYPVSWRRKGGKPTPEDRASEAQAVALAKNPNYIGQRDAIAKQMGADHVTVLSPPNPDAPAPTDQPVAQIYLPLPLTEQSVAEAADAVMQWFEGSLLGRIYFAQGRQNGFRGELTVKGFTYETLDSLSYLKPNVDDDDYKHSVNHCACH
jgi:hypothetical protein